MNDQPTTPTEPQRPILHPHSLISELVDEAVVQFGVKPVTQEMFTEFVNQKSEAWAWCLAVLGTKPALKFFGQLYEMRKARHATPPN